MINPGVLTLASLQDCLPSFPYRFEIEDNIGEAIHIHYKDIRLEFSIREFLKVAETAEMLIYQLVDMEGFSLEQFDPINFVVVAGILPSIDHFEEDELFLNDITVDTMDSDGAICYGPLEHSRVIRALRGDTAQNDSHHEVNYYKPCSAARYTNGERVRFNLDRIRQEGYPNNQERILVEGEKNVIWDGQHRAASLYYLKGNITVPVKRIHWRDSEKIVASEGNFAGSLYYRMANQKFREDSRFGTSVKQLRDGQTFTLMPGINELRFDPLEGQFCIVSGLEVSCENGQVRVFPENGIQYNNQYYFFTTDPKIVIQLLSSTIRKITIKAVVTPLSTAQSNELLQLLLSELHQQQVSVQQLESQTCQLQEKTETLEWQCMDKERKLQEQEKRTNALSRRLEEKQSHFCQLKAALCVQEERANRLALRNREQERTAADWEARETAVRRELEELRVHYHNMEHSVSFRLGRIITWLPRKLKAFWKRKFIMRNYYGDLLNRINICESRYADSPRKTALRMIWWNTKVLLKHQILAECATSDKEENESPPLDENNFNVGFVIGGGFGDNLIFANYLNAFRKKYQCQNMKIDVFFSLGYKLADSIFEPGVICDRFFPEMDNISQRYDLFIWVNRYPKVYVSKRDRIQRFKPELLEYISVCDEFQRKYPLVFEESPYHDGEMAELCVAEGRTRIQQPDIGGLLNIGKDFDMPMFIHQDSDAYLVDLGLKGRRFITLHRGNDVQYSNHAVKLWPIEYYNELITAVKEKYPDCLLVQVGVSRDRCPPMEGVDIDLVGRTSMEDMKVLLRFALTHVDSEGGFIHLRHALKGGPSVALFGPTSMEFFGYQENVNIRGSACTQPCEWRTRDWLEHCPRGMEKPPCMSSIHPERVIKEVCRIIEKSQEEEYDGLA